MTSTPHATFPSLRVRLQLRVYMYKCRVFFVVIQNKLQWHQYLTFDSWCLFCSENFTGCFCCFFFIGNSAFPSPHSPFFPLQSHDWMMSQFIFWTVFPVNHQCIVGLPSLIIRLVDLISVDLGVSIFFFY